MIEITIFIFIGVKLRLIKIKEWGYHGYALRVVKKHVMD
jgi:hypothetical protein